VNAKTGAVTFTVSVSDPGVFSWLLTFQNGVFGTVARRRSGCDAGQVKLQGKCRSSRVIFGKGSLTASSAGTVSFTVAPGAAAKRTLQAAHSKRRGLAVRALLTFLASGGTSPASQTRSLTVKLRATNRRTHRR
jgi:hypothetical protein